MWNQWLELNLMRKLYLVKKCGLSEKAKNGTVEMDLTINGEKLEGKRLIHILEKSVEEYTERPVELPSH
jgi:hypothetical protein